MTAQPRFSIFITGSFLAVCSSNSQAVVVLALRNTKYGY
jgi:hypothetical protein